MNWFKAKNLILILLIVLNTFLLALNVVTNNNYVLSNEQTENIYKVLSSKYNIGIYAELPKKYEPMKEIEVVNEGEGLTEFLYGLFFDETDNVSKLVDNDKIMYQSDDKTLMTQVGDFILTVNNGQVDSREQIIKEFNNYANEYVLYDSYTNDNVVVYDYRQKFKDEIIYTNYLTIEETDGEVSRVEGYYARPTGFIGDSKEIVSIDLVLFNLANFYPRGEDEQLFIDSIDLVYNQEQIVSEPDVVLKATPCYLVEVRGSLAPVKIDAYTNTILSK